MTTTLLSMLLYSYSYHLQVGWPFQPKLNIHVSQVSFTSHLVVISAPGSSLDSIYIYIYTYIFMSISIIMCLCLFL